MPRRKEKTVIRNGIEYYYKSIRDERGKYITVYGRTIAERDEKVKKREAEIRLRRKIKEFPTFSERATEWLSDKSKDLKRNTYNNYEQIIRTHFIPVLGNKRLIDITGEDVKAAMAVAEAQSASVYRKASMLIKQIFADALTCDLIQVDPTTKHLSGGHGTHHLHAGGAALARRRHRLGGGVVPLHHALSGLDRRVLCRP